MSAHHCHAKFCKIKTKPEMLMCFKHWKMVPRQIQLKVWRHYRPGQCEDKQPSPGWHQAADEAIAAVLRQELVKCPWCDRQLHLSQLCPTCNKRAEEL